MAIVGESRMSRMSRRNTTDKDTDKIQIKKIKTHYGPWRKNATNRAGDVQLSLLASPFIPEADSAYARSRFRHVQQVMTARRVITPTGSLKPIPPFSGKPIG